MFWIKATTRFISAWQRPDETMREIETELRFHIEMRTRANVEQGMRPDDARRAAFQSFGDFERVKSNCREIRRSLPFDTTPWKMGLHITVAVLAGSAALWAVNVPHHNLMGLLWQLVAIAVLAVLFMFARRARSTRLRSEFASDVFVTQNETFRDNHSLMSDESSAKISAFDEQGRTPVERVFKSLIDSTGED
jgi:hypothetical protein